MINAKANGSLKVENGKAILAINGELSNSDGNFSSVITITLVDAK